MTEQLSSTTQNKRTSFAILLLYTSSSTERMREQWTYLIAALLVPIYRGHPYLYQENWSRQRRHDAVEIYTEGESRHSVHGWGEPTDIKGSAERMEEWSQGPVASSSFIASNHPITKYAIPAASTRNPMSHRINLCFAVARTWSIFFLRAGLDAM